MIRTILARAAAVALASSALLAPPTPGYAASSLAPPTPGFAASSLAAPTPGFAGSAASRRTELTLSYAADAGYATAVMLRCDPPGGGHPKPARACRVLTKAGGSPSNLRPARRMCMMIYAPITARITGVWRGARIGWSRRFGNTCEMNRATGVLFEF